MRIRNCTLDVDDKHQMRRLHPEFIDVADDAREAELAFLKAEIYRGEIDLLTRRIDAYDRFSDRC
jgi:hypothetical protein